MREELHNWSADKLRVEVSSATPSRHWAKSLSGARSLEEARVRAAHSDSRVTQAVYRRLPETATVMDIGHLKSKNIRQ